MVSFKYFIQKTQLNGYKSACTQVFWIKSGKIFPVYWTKYCTYMAWHIFWHYNFLIREEKTLGKHLKWSNTEIVINMLNKVLIASVKTMILYMLLMIVDSW